MPFFMMPTGTRECLAWIRDRIDYKIARLKKRIAYGGKKGRSAARRLRRMGGDHNVFREPERVIAELYGPEYARPPYGFARESQSDG
jgi:hypothetical protein